MDLQQPAPRATSESFPILAVTVIGILATALLLLAYYVFVIKCCLTWRHLDLLRRLNFPRSASSQPPLPSRGLNHLTIRSIPVVTFRANPPGAQECSVCLSEFRDSDRLRLIPNCRHMFHIDCIDVWLQTNANCPVCRAAIASRPHFFGDVVIEVDGEGRSDGSLATREKVYSIGDEIIDIRKEDRLGVRQPMRRSFSLDSSSDPLFRRSVSEIRETGGCFSFGQGRSSILPVNSE